MRERAKSGARTKKAERGGGGEKQRKTSLSLLLPSPLSLFFVLAPLFAGSLISRRSPRGKETTCSLEIPARSPFSSPAQSSYILIVLIARACSRTPFEKPQGTSAEERVLELLVHPCIGCTDTLEASIRISARSPFSSPVLQYIHCPCLLSIPPE